MSQPRGATALRGVERTQISNLHAKVRAVHEGRVSMPVRSMLNAWGAKLRERLTRMRELDREIAAQLTEEQRLEQSEVSERYYVMAEEAIALVDEWLTGRARETSERSPVDILEQPVNLRRTTPNDLTRNTIVHHPIERAPLVPLLAPGAHLGPTPPQLDTTPEVFSGDRRRYRVFRNHFDNWIARRTQASEIDKLVALTRLLQGAPKALVESLPWMPTSFEIALQLLDDNYGGVVFERDQHLAELMTIKRVDTADLEGLWVLVNGVNVSVQLLESLGTELGSYAVAFWPVLRAAVPSDLYFDFTERRFREGGSEALASESSETRVREIRELLQFITRYIKHREQCQVLPVEAAKRSRMRSDGAARRYQPYPKATAATAETSSEGAELKECIFCGSEGHRSYRCQSRQSVSQRWDVLRTKRRCFRCFRSDHRRARCKHPGVVCDTCGSRQHFAPVCKEVSTTAIVVQDAETDQVATANAGVAGGVHRTMLQTAQAILQHEGQQVPVRLFLDSGSSITFVAEQVIAAFPNLRPRQDAILSVQGFGVEPVSLRSRQYRLQLQSKHEPLTRIELLAFGHPCLKVNPQYQIPSRVKQEIERFQVTHPLADESVLQGTTAEPPQILVGLDQMFKVFARSHELPVVDDLTARKTALGWVLGGPIPSAGGGEIVAYCMTCCAANGTAPAADVERLWKMEAIGIERETEATMMSANDEAAVQQFESSISYNGKYYQVAMPRKETFGMVRTNLTAAAKRLESKLRSLVGEPATYARYDKEIRAFLEQGFARLVPNFDVGDEQQHVGAYYMPHHQVVTGTPEKPKWRIVFDCSSGQPRTSSLNANLLAGPDVNPSLGECLLNVRMKPVAVSGDVAKAYMQIHLVPEDWKLFRFLWKGPLDERVICLEMNRVTWGAAPSAFLLSATLRKHFKVIDPANKFQLSRRFFMDDMMHSFATEQEAKTFVRFISEGLKAAGMELSKWKTNSAEVQAYLTELGYDVSGQPEQKILGVVWDLEGDTLSLTIPSAAAKPNVGEELTRRKVLKRVASVFDPMGWCIPFLVRGKLLLRSLWECELAWDQSIPDQVAQEFRVWSAEVEALTSIKLQRCYQPSGRQIVERHLHVFGDASEKAYAAVAYMQAWGADKVSAVSLLMAKSRVAPKKAPSMPRLELLAALLAARLRRFIEAALPEVFTRTFLYTDSQVAFYWIVNAEPGRYQQFVANRVAEIQRSTGGHEWFLVPGTQNIADFATRGVEVSVLISNEEWWHGPPWLARVLEARPAQQPRRQQVDHAAEAVELRDTVALVKATAPPLLQFERYSSFEKVVRVVAITLRFICRLRRNPAPIPVVVMRQAETLIFKWTQEQFLAVEIACVRKGAPVPTTSKLAKYRLSLDEVGLLRLETRLVHAAFLTEEEKRPIILPGEARLSELLILQVHRMNAHFGVPTILSNLRKRFWVTRARQVTKGLLRRCVVCRKRGAKPADQVRAPLPDFRANLVAVFATTGVDLCGPFYTKERGQDAPSKTYIAIFTCAAIRAVHLELIRSQGADDFQLALRRFLSVYPGCTRLVSDNAKTFAKAATELKKLYNHVNDRGVRDLLAARRISWNFQCPQAPWHGGFFERLVRSIKDALARTLGRSLVSFEVLRTIIQETATVINSRPLTYLSDDPDDWKPISPSDFLGGHNLLPLTMQSPVAVGDRPEHATVLAKAARASATFARHLATRWQNEYLRHLRSANVGDAGEDRPIQAGDVALLRDPSRSRLHWPLVRIVNAHLGVDGRPRVYTVRTSSGLVTRRPAQALIPLEVGPPEVK